VKYTEIDRQRERGERERERERERSVVPTLSVANMV
jgi:hypothetical protein